MTQRVSGAVAMDMTAITLSGLCLVHCLALPLMAVFFPVLGLWAEAEWVHKVFVAIAVPVSGFMIFRSWTAPGGKAFAALALAGLALLIVAAFVEALHDLETPLTVLGALLLATAHIRRWMKHSADHIHQA